MPRVLIGKTHDLCGKSLWEILCNLKDFGVGRVLVKTKNVRRYPEKSWLRVLKVEPKMDEENRHGTVSVENVFRGVRSPKVRVIARASAATDYQLVPKHMEADVCIMCPERETWVKKLPATMVKPPLMMELERAYGVDGAEVANDLPIVYACPGELVEVKHPSPVEVPDLQLGKPASPQLYIYEGIS